jgi:cytoskeletal protein CcmA (bactofilin family)
MTLTIIATGTLVSGELHCEDDLTIEGRVEGSITAQGVVTIGDTGEVLSDVTAGDVVVLGSLEGDIVAAGTVEIATGGRVEGDIKAARVILSEGAVFRGSIDMGGAEERPRKAHGHRQMRGATLPEPSKPRHQLERSNERYPAVERPRRPSPPQPPPMTPTATVPARPPHVVRPAVPEAEVVAPLRAPEPKVRGVGRTTALKR